jgi:hypothetical protein
MGQESTSDGMHPASKWLLDVIAENKEDNLAQRAALLLAAWWINHDRPPSAQQVDKVARDLSANRDAVQRVFATLGSAGKPASATPR